MPLGVGATRAFPHTPRAQAWALAATPAPEGGLGALAAWPKPPALAKRPSRASSASLASSPPPTCLRAHAGWAVRGELLGCCRPVLGPTSECRRTLLRREEPMPSLGASAINIALGTETSSHSNPRSLPPRDNHPLCRPQLPLQKVMARAASATASGWPSCGELTPRYCPIRTVTPSAATTSRTKCPSAGLADATPALSRPVHTHIHLLAQEVRTRRLDRGPRGGPRPDPTCFSGRT